MGKESVKKKHKVKVNENGDIKVGGVPLWYKPRNGCLLGVAVFVLGILTIVSLLLVACNS